MANNFFRLCAEHWGDIGHYLKKYWKGLGGWKEILASPFLLLSLLISAICFRLWTGPNWWFSPLSVLPNLLGFSLAAYAILLSFGTERFLRALVMSNVNDQSAYDFLHSIFIHFVLTQVVALLAAVVAMGLFTPMPRFLEAWLCRNAPLQDVVQTGLIVFSFFSFWLFAYALSLTIYCIISVYTVAGLVKEAIIGGNSKNIPTSDDAPPKA